MKASENVVALGAGRMGRGIAHMFAYAGHPVTLLDIKQRSSEAFEHLRAEAREEIRDNMTFLASLDVMTPGQVEAALQLIDIRGPAAAPDALSQAHVIIEAVPETQEAKAGALNLVSSLAGEQAVVTSTTSAFQVAELQELIQHPSRFLNTHFLNPAYLIPLVEVSASEVTEEPAVALVMELFQRIGKVPVRCSARPGYIIPRLQSLLMAEACRMVAEGVATPADLDKAIMNGFGPRYATMGIMEFIDWGGVDILHYAGHHLADDLNSPAHRPPPEVDRMMADGRKGMREGQGYYDFRNMDVPAFQKAKLTRFVRLLGSLGQIPKPGVAADPS